MTDDSSTAAGTTQDGPDSTPGGHEAGVAAGDGETHPGETHVGGLSARLNWLRACVLGANDGIVSVAGLVVGVAGATLERSPILVAGLAAGAVSMALGEYISVSSQRDSELAQLATERHELAQDPDAELHELTTLYQAKGLTPATARTVAAELTARVALAAHVDSSWFWRYALQPEQLRAETTRSRPTAST